MTSQKTQRITPRSKKVLSKATAGAAIAGVVASLGLVAGSGAAVAQDSCAGTVALGIPGTNQGKAHNPDGKDAAALLGEQVAATMKVLDTEILDLRSVALNYMAEGVGGLVGEDAAIAKIAYDASVYKVSKGSGYNAAYDFVATTASQCPSAKFVLVGYSQGAHIAGDLTQAILHGNGPVGKGRLAVSVLLADPGYNGASPNANEFRYDGPRPDETNFDHNSDVLVTDPDHWKISGSLGTRAAFDSSDPVISVCVYGDPVCDGGSVGLNAPAASAKSWMHTALYTKVGYGQDANLATWAGKEAADKVRG